MRAISRLLMWMILLMVFITLYLFNINSYRTALNTLVSSINKAIITTREMYSQIPFDRLDHIKQVAVPSVPIPYNSSNNMVKNGNFEEGFIGFETEYQHLVPGPRYTFTYEGKGWCSVNHDLKNFRVLEWGQIDSTSKNKMLIADGATDKERTLWKQTVQVDPTATYTFSMKIKNIVKSDVYTTHSWQRAMISLLVNDSVIQHMPCLTFNDYFKQYAFTIPPSSKNSITLVLRDENTIGVFNDFAIDDIMLLPYSNEHIPHLSFHGIHKPYSIQDKLDIYQELFSYRMYSYNYILKYKLLFNTENMMKQDYDIYRTQLASKTKHELFFGTQSDTLYTSIINGIDENHPAQCAFTGHRGYILGYDRFAHRLSLLVLALLLVVYALLERSARKDKSLIEYKSDMLAKVAHEIKTPVAAIMASIEGLNKYGLQHDPEKRSQYLGFIMTQAERVSGLTGKILSQKSMDSNMTLNAHEFELKKSIQQVIQSYYYPSNKKYNIDLQCQPDNLMLIADESHFQNIIITLFDNAFKYSHPVLNLNIMCKRVESEIHVSIQDDGMGIQSKDILKIWKKHYRSPQHQNIVDGTGLGLYYVKKIMALHKGKAVATSDGKSGSIFTLKYKSNA